MPYKDSMRMSCSPLCNTGQNKRWRPYLLDMIYRHIVAVWLHSGVGIEYLVRCKVHYISMLPTLKVQKVSKITIVEDSMPVRRYACVLQMYMHSKWSPFNTPGFLRTLHAVALHIYTKSCTLHCTLFATLPLRSRCPLRCKRTKGARRVATQKICPCVLAK